MEDFVSHMSVFGCFIYICIYLPDVHPGEKVEAFTDSTLNNNNNSRLRKHTLDSSVMKKTDAESKTRGRKLNPHVTCVVDSCQGKVAGVLF